MKHFLCLILFLAAFQLSAQLSYEKDIQLGTIESAYEIKGDLVVSNTGASKAFLMRADAEPGVLIHTSKKSLHPGDTCLLTISFLPTTKGVFSKTIKLVSSDREKPYLITLSGTLLNYKNNDKQACYYFGSRRNSLVAQKQGTIEVPVSEPKRDVSNKMPDARDNPRPPVAVATPMVTDKKTPTENSAFPDEEFKPNNIVFLVDVSGSMKDSLKLPVMKKALHFLVDQIRDTDKITFITYADTIKIITEAAGANRAAELHQTIDQLKAKGMTKGRKAILFSQSVTQKNYIEGGNNQIIIATDGKFRFEKEDQKLWTDRQGNKPVVLSTVAFGDEKEALNNLKDIARKGKGSFIHIKAGDDGRQKLMDEVRNRSRK